MIGQVHGNGADAVNKLQCCQNRIQLQSAAEQPEFDRIAVAEIDGDIAVATAFRLD